MERPLLSSAHTDKNQRPERILQFGSSSFLRALSNVYIHEANERGDINASLVVVQSSRSKRAEILNRQDGLYTLIEQGLENGCPKQQTRIITSISRLLQAQDDWEILKKIIASEELNLIISNTTESGIVFQDEDSFSNASQASFPGKLTALLYHRFSASSHKEKPIMILPCELIAENGTLLHQAVNKYIKHWTLGAGFERWLEETVDFANTLVDRIVSGEPSEQELEVLQEEWGYRDEAVVVSEWYRLWAIETDKPDHIALEFAKNEASIKIQSNIDEYAELKIRILNGTHTALTPLAFLAGADTMKEALDDTALANFTCALVYDEIAPNLSVAEKTARDYGSEVLHRFRNPELNHELLSIALEQTSKIKSRLVPSILAFYQNQHHPPRQLCLSLAAYLYMFKAQKNEKSYFGTRSGQAYPLRDKHIPLLLQCWQNIYNDDITACTALTHHVFSKEELWGQDLSVLPSFTETVGYYLSEFIHRGVRNIVEELFCEPEGLH